MKLKKKGGGHFYLYEVYNSTTSKTKSAWSEH